MGKMREAFKRWIMIQPSHKTERPVAFEAGYQAAIADVKAGGVVAWLNKKIPHMAVLTKPYEGGGWFPVIKLPEDV